MNSEHLLYRVGTIVYRNEETSPTSKYSDVVFDEQTGSLWKMEWNYSTHKLKFAGKSLVYLPPLTCPPSTPLFPYASQCMLG